MIDKAKFKELFPITRNKELAEMFGVTESTIRMWGSKLGLKKENWKWTKKQEQYILENWEKRTSENIAKELKRTEWSVINKYRELTGLRGKHGGARPNSGPDKKYGEPTTTIAFRVPVSKVQEIKEMVNDKLNEYKV